MTDGRSQWIFAGTPGGDPQRPEGTTLVSGTSFCASSVTGDILPGAVQGLFYRDTRFLSGWQVLIDGAPSEPLSVIGGEPFWSRFICRASPPAGRADSTLLVIRSRWVGEGMREELVLRNLAPSPVSVRLTILIEADFADLFDVKDRHVLPSPATEFVRHESALRLSPVGPGPRRVVSINLPAGSETEHGWMAVDIEIPGRSEWSYCFEVEVGMDGGESRPHGVRNSSETDRAAAARLRRWKAAITGITASDPALEAALAQGIEDIGALRMVDPDGSGGAVVAAGAPWFMALFGRDSLLTAWMTLPLDPTLAASTLKILARYQGTTIHRQTEEQPGRILHEMRWGLTNARDGETGGRYYGTVDAPALYVMLLGEAARWGLELGLTEELLPSADRALAWLARDADLDGDGFVEYLRLGDAGLANQGWKDSWDGINFADGRVAEAPIALCEVQGYVYAAYLARARLAHLFGDAQTRADYTEKAGALKMAFNRAFWLPERGYFAVGLDREKEPIDSLTSNLGHCLWTGIIDEDKAPVIVDRLMSPEMLSGWGLRTLSTRMGAYNPVSYHNGSVWPHDTALAVAGLSRYGFRKQAAQLTRALLDASVVFHGRLPELFCGFSRAEFPVPVSYPASCSPQAWAAAVPFSLVRSLLGLEPAWDSDHLDVVPDLPAQLGGIQLQHLLFRGQRLAVDATGNRATVTAAATS